MTMDVTDIAWASLGATLIVVIVVGVFLAGRNYGYWKRVAEEKGARDIP